MKICIISDTHNKHKLINLPDADLIIHCGDFTSMGYEHEVKNFLKWYSSLEQFKYKLFIAGNHDWLFEKNNILAKSLIPNNVIYLEDSEIIIDGYKFYGTPVQKIFRNWAFNRPEEKLKQHWNNIPDDTDVLITHEAPYGVYDFGSTFLHEGSISLYKEIVKRINPKIHCFGHYHDCNGIEKINDIRFVNATLLNNKYELIYEPIIIEL